MIEDLEREVGILGLADHPYWHKLLHYRARSESVRSAARSPEFFLSTDGAHDPSAELLATLRVFAGDDDIARCRYPARFRWLDDRLDLAAFGVRALACPELDEWRDAIAPDRITLVFASSYVNNPASMYGHTLLRIDQPGDRGADQLVAYAVNHAAVTDESSGLLFAIRGLTGGYDGTFSLLPYYDKVKDYNDVESRDLWEYELALGPNELERVVLHLWELRNIRFRYFFFLQNCSYRLLQLLEVARPGLELTDRFRVAAIPTDTVRAVLAQEGMLREVRYRPGAATVLRAHLARLSPPARDLVSALAAGDRSPDGPELRGLTETEQGQVLQVAYELLHHRAARGGVDEDAGNRLHALLVARSRVAGGEALEASAPPSVRPDEGHPTARISLACGRRDGGSFGAFRFRAAYHDWLDPQAGYQENARIDFFDVEIRRERERGRTRLERLVFVNLDSLAPRDRFFSRVSWNVRFGLLREKTAPATRALVPGLDGGSAWAFSVATVGRPVVFAGWQSSLRIGNEFRRSYRAGAGPRLGAVFDWGRAGRSLLEGLHLWYLHESEPGWSARLSHRVPLTSRTALGATASRDSTLGLAGEEVSLAFFFYH